MKALMLRKARKLVILIMGASVILVGIIMLVTPGPGTVVIPAGLAILATEFLWARRLLNHIKKKAVDTVKSFTGNSEKPPDANKDEK
ncbi:MAG: PGPGW domain-containing protein [Candidatus Hydrogenedentes bacterium]|nr:PGPGW domain-containing protein [Candidatus Hydrogenedentota bacterium]